jgi:hypothetical protein
MRNLLLGSALLFATAASAQDVTIKDMPAGIPLMAVVQRLTPEALEQIRQVCQPPASECAWDDDACRWEKHN